MALWRRMDLVAYLARLQGLMLSTYCFLVASVEVEREHPENSLELEVRVEVDNEAERRSEEREGASVVEEDRMMDIACARQDILLWRSECSGGVYRA
jgi:hypothetical protein